jgi:hypothetical protein
VLAPSGAGGSRIRGLQGVSGEAKKGLRVTAGRTGQLVRCVNGLAEGGKLRGGFELAEAFGLLPGAQGDREGALRRVGKGAHSRRGKQATARSRVGVVETVGERRRVVRSRTLVRAREGAGGLERGPRSLRGECSREEAQERLRHETRPWNSSVLGNR